MSPGYGANATPSWSESRLGAQVPKKPMTNSTSVPTPLNSRPLPAKPGNSMQRDPPSTSNIKRALNNPPPPPSKPPPTMTNTLPRHSGDVPRRRTPGASTLPRPTSGNSRDLSSRPLPPPPPPGPPAPSGRPPPPSRQPPSSATSSGRNPPPLPPTRTVSNHTAAASFVRPPYGAKPPHTQPAGPPPPPTRGPPPPSRVAVPPPSRVAVPPPSRVAVPPPPARHSSMMISEDFESRYQFPDMNQFPPPEPFTSCTKTYPSKSERRSTSARREPPPPPPIGY